MTDIEKDTIRYMYRYYYRMGEKTKIKKLQPVIVKHKIDCSTDSRFDRIIAEAVNQVTKDIHKYAAEQFEKVMEGKK